MQKNEENENRKKKSLIESHLKILQTNRKKKIDQRSFFEIKTAVSSAKKNKSKPDEIGEQKGHRFQDTLLVWRMKEGKGKSCLFPLPSSSSSSSSSFFCSSAQARQTIQPQRKEKPSKNVLDTFKGSIFLPDHSSSSSRNQKLDDDTFIFMKKNLFLFHSNLIFFKPTAWILAVLCEGQAVCTNLPLSVIQYSSYYFECSNY